ncbi:MAG: M23 family metallopeptidase [Fidelibacterota bacterium]
MAVLLPVKLSSQNYLWPTNSGLFLTSTFGEFRPGHFHSGLDIKTWNRQGYKVFAVDDGYIYRLKVSPFGYGKAIYLKLDSGYMAVYAHLQRFNDILESIVDEKQQELQKYRVDIFFKNGEIAVKRGDLIAYTGKTGTKAPHLHFELRDSLNNPLNPLLYGFRVNDLISPTPTRISFIPLSVNSEINGKLKESISRIKYVRKDHYTFPETIQLYGKIGIAVDAYDRMGGVPNRYGVYRIELYLDDKLIFQVKYDKISFEKTRRVYLDRNYRLWRKGKGIFYNLFRYKQNDLPIYTTHSSGTIGPDLQPGYYRVKIVLADRFDNRAYIEGKILYSKLENKNISTVLKNPATHNTSRDPQVKIEKVMYDKFIYLEIDTGIPLPEEPLLYFISDNGVERLPLRREDPNSFSSRIKLKNSFSGEGYLKFVSMENPSISRVIPLNLTMITPHGGGKALSADGVCEMIFPAGSVYDTLFARIPVDNPEYYGSQKLITKIYAAQPYEIPLKGEALVNIKYPRNTENPEKLGLFYFNRKMGWTFISGQKKEGRITARVNSMESFAIIKDKVPPFIEGVRPINGAAVNKTLKKISAYVGDNLSGIPDEESIDLLLDGKKLIFEYVADENLIFYKFKKQLDRGRHIIEIYASDALKNRSYYRGQFFIK